MAKAIFKKRYSKYLALQKLGTARSEAQTIKYAHAINRLIQLHPYGSYAYKGKGAGKSALKGKGESSLLPLAKQIQLPANNGFVSAKRAARRNARVLKALQRLGMK